jgi:hypothetical protein
MNRRYTANEVSEIRFYQLPKPLYENEKYKGLSDSAKVTYSILRDRQDISIKNEWVDENGNVFFFFDTRKLAELQKKSPTTIHTNKKALIKYGLLESVRIGQGKPNKLYILKPETVEGVENYKSCNTRTTKIVTPELQSLVHSDTELSETERTKQLTSNYEFDDNVKTFLQEYYNYFGYKHRNINNVVTFEREVTSYDVKEYSKHFFDEYSNNDKKHNLEKCSINNFVEHLKRYMRE